MKTKLDDCAFPAKAGIDTSLGLTKREYFSLILMQSLITNPYYRERSYKEAADDAVKAAETLLSNLEEE